MNIVFNCDNNYAPFLATTILSIITNTPSLINFYVLDLDIKEDSKQKISEIVKNSNNNITFISIDKELFLNLPKTIDYISPVTYARLKVAEYLSHIDKVLYLDIDILVNGDLSLLWNIDLDNYYLGGCIDPHIETYNISYKNIIGLSKEDKYINAGVLLMNLEKIRKLDLFEEGIKLFRKINNMKYQDQDIINVIFKNNILYLNSRFNFTLNHRSEITSKFKNNIIDSTPPNTPILPIIIYHYVGHVKPWNKRCTQSMANIYDRYMKNILKMDNIPDEWREKMDVKPFKIIVKNYLKDVKNKYKYRIF